MERNSASAREKKRRLGLLAMIKAWVQDDKKGTAPRKFREGASHRNRAKCRRTAAKEASARRETKVLQKRRRAKGRNPATGE